MSNTLSLEAYKAVTWSTVHLPLQRLRMLSHPPSLVQFKETLICLTVWINLLEEYVINLALHSYNILRLVMDSLKFTVSKSMQQNHTHSLLHSLNSSFIGKVYITTMSLINLTEDKLLSNSTTSDFQTSFQSQLSLTQVTSHGAIY